MNNWEKMFKSLHKGTQAHDNGAACRAALDAQAEAGADSALPPDPTGCSPLPQAFEEMRLHLGNLWSNILLESGPKTDLLMFCGSAAGDGCSFISFHLALFLATVHSMKTLYVDTTIDVPDHEPCIPGMSGRAGLASFLTSEAKLDSLIVETDYTNLFVLPSGARQVGSSVHENIIAGHAVDELAEYCRANFDITILDGQPIATRPATIEIAKRIKSVILVCRYGSSRREVSMVSIDKLRKNGISVTGVVLNDRQFPVPPSIYAIMK